MTLSKLQRRALDLAKKNGCLQRADKHEWYPSVEDLMEREKKTEDALQAFYESNPQLRRGFGIPPSEEGVIRSEMYEYYRNNSVGTATVRSLVSRGLMRWDGPKWARADFQNTVKL